MVIRFSFVCVLHWYIMRKDRCNASLAYYWQVQQISASVAVQALHGVAVYNMFLTRSYEYWLPVVNNINGILVFQYT